MKKNLILALIILPAILASSCQLYRKFDYQTIETSKIFALNDSVLDSIIRTIEKYHPEPFGELFKHEVDSIKSEILNKHNNTLLTAPDFTLAVRELTDHFTFNDPHFIYYPKLQVNSDFKGKLKNFRILPFEILQINDTLLIEKSYNKKLKPGDRLISINGFNIETYRKYVYPNWRSFKGSTLQIQSQITFASHYEIILERKDEIISEKVKGKPFKRGTGARISYGKLIEDAETGYFKINRFTYNKNIIKKLGQQIDKNRKAGYTNFIIDVRGNTGGSGDRFDELLSLLTNKDSLKYMKSQYLKVSSETVDDYDFITKKEIGQLIRLPDSLTFNHIPLLPHKYKGNMNYYILINNSTASMAATLANIIQHNGIGKLVGEPLQHNALKYGEIIEKSAIQMMILSTMKFNEASNAVDGVLNPDIVIPYIVIEHQKNEDPILDNLLNHITTSK